MSIAGAQDRRRHLSRHARGRAAPASNCCGSHGAGATFLFSLGPDHTGRAIKRVFRPGFMQQGSPHVRVRALRRHDAAVRHGAARARHRPALRRHHAQRARRRLRGRHPHLGPRQMAGRRRAARMPQWTAREMQLACDRYAEIFGEPPHVHGAAGWQMNRHAYRLTQPWASTIARTRAARIRSSADVQRRD